jgi:GNAT superfamily N-acetyltransferase
LALRTALIDDAETVARLVTLAYRVEDFFVHGDRTSAAEVREKMRTGEFLLLEEDGGRLAGCVYVEVRGDTGYFGMLSTDPALQRRGLGTRLVAAAEAWCRRSGCTAIEIEVVNHRHELPPFYRRLGYEDAGTRPFPQDARIKLPCYFALMTKRL